MQDPPRIRSCGFSGATCRTKLLPHSVFRTREHPQSSGSARGARPASNWILRFSPAQCAEQSFCRAPYFTQGNIHRAAGVPKVQDPPRIKLYGFSGAMRRTKLLPRSVFHRKGTSTEQRGCSRGQGPPRIEFCGFIRRNVPDKTAPELLAPGRPRSYGNGGCNTHRTARC